MSEENRGSAEYTQLLLDNQLCFPLYAAARKVVNAYNPLLKKMEESGWLNRCRCKVDERVVYVSLTDKGWELREKVREIPERMGRCITMPKEEAYSLYTLLHKLLDSME